MSGVVSGMLRAYVLVVLSKTLTYEREYPEGKFQERLAVVPLEEQEFDRLVGEGMVSEQEVSLVPPFAPLQLHVQVVLSKAWLALVPLVQL